MRVDVCSLGYLGARSSIIIRARRRLRKNEAGDSCSATSGREGGKRIHWGVFRDIIMVCRNPDGVPSKTRGPAIT